MQLVRSSASLVPAVLCAGMAVGQEGPQVVDGNGAVVPVPSGQTVTLQEVIWNVPGPEGMTTRFRFLAPDVAGAVDFDTAEADMIALCESYAVPRLTEFGPQPEQVVISLSASAIAFGDPAPDVVQFFESYRIEDGKCLWEMY